MPPMRALLLLCFFATSAFAQPKYDLLLTGGRVIDPRNHISAVKDVAIMDGKIAAVAANIPAAQAFKVVNVTGLYVTPGLVDIHVHVYATTGMPGYAGDRSVLPDGFTFRNGVTTVVDAGTSGWRTFPDFKARVIDRSKTRVLALLNIVGAGMGTGHEDELAELDAAAAAKTAKANRGVIVG